MGIRMDYKYKFWTGVKAHCPICKNIFTGWYCPSCGLPKKNSKYAINEYGIHNCGQYHFRPEFSSFENFKLCDKCYTTNPLDAKYCRNCGRKFNFSKGVTKNAHGWVDLGLSVLWATEVIEGLYFWNNASELSHTTDISDFKKWRDINRIKWSYYKGSESSNEEDVDVATQILGKKWRTPTKEEFEELMIKCKWEKCIDPKSNKHALKVIGPNGNLIILPVTGYAGCNAIVKQKQGTGTLDDLLSKEMPKKLHADSEAEYSLCALWTSSKDTTRQGFAYAFYYTGYKDFTKTLTEKEKKEIEFENARYKREFSHFFKIESCEEILHRHLNESKIQATERQILKNMGDDSQERIENIKKDKERRRDLWLNTPIELRLNEDRHYKNTIKLSAIDKGYAILPVVDKKWKGKL